MCLKLHKNERNFILGVKICFSETLYTTINEYIQDISTVNSVTGNKVLHAKKEL